MSPLAVLAPGAVLDGKWRIEGLLGEGGMGAVYRARHVRNGSVVAIKVLHPDLAKDPLLRERFLHEGYAANQVGHPGTVRVLDDGQVRDGHVYLVMEMLVGETAEQMLARRGGRLPFGEAIPILDALLDTLAAAHAAGTIHRDIKPENLFLTTDGTLKVLDFGLARVREGAGQARLTVTGVPMGTPAFMPAEQAMARWDEVGARSDVYSIAATIWYLLSGRLVHEGRTVPELLVAVSTRSAAPIRSVCPELPAAIASILDRALSLDPAMRWADAREMHAALRAALSTATGVALAAARTGAGIGLPYDATADAGFSSPSRLAARGLADGEVTTPLVRARSSTGDPRVPSAHDLAAQGRSPSFVPPTQQGAPLAAMMHGIPRGVAATAVGTVAPITTDPAIARPRPDTKLVVGAAGFVGVVAIAAVALFVVHRERADRAPSSAHVPSGAPATSASPETASTAPPLVSPSSAPAPSSGAAAAPSSAGAAAPSSAGEPPVVAKPTVKPTAKAAASASKPAHATPIDPLSDYKHK